MSDDNNEAQGGIAALLGSASQSNLPEDTPWALRESRRLALELAVEVGKASGEAYILDLADKFFLFLTTTGDTAK